MNSKANFQEIKQKIFSIQSMRISAHQSMQSRMKSAMSSISQQLQNSLQLFEQGIQVDFKTVEGESASCVQLLDKKLIHAIEQFQEMKTTCHKQFNLIQKSNIHSLQLENQLKGKIYRTKEEIEAEVQASIRKEKGERGLSIKKINNGLNVIKKYMDRIYLAKYTSLNDLIEVRKEEISQLKEERIERAKQIHQVIHKE